MRILRSLLTFFGFFAGASSVEDDPEIRLLSRRVGHRDTLTGVLLMIPSVATTSLTYFGISEPLQEAGLGLVSKGQALAFAVTIGVFSWLGWFYAFGLLYRLHGPRLRQALLAACSFLAMIVLIDAPFNMAALGGSTGVQLSIAKTAKHYETRKNTVFRETTVVRQLLPAIEAQRARFAAQAASERTNGTYSGSRGVGKVSAGFDQIAILLEQLTRDLKAGLDQAEALQDEITTIFAGIRADTYEAGPLRPRVKRVTIAADEMDAAIGKLAQYDYRVSIEATLSSLRTIFPTPDVAGSEFEAIQNAQIAVIAEMAGPVADILLNALGQLESDEAVAIEAIRPENAILAIRTHWRPLIFQWTAALFVDVAPAALLVILISAFREIDARRAAALRSNKAPSSKNAKGDPS